MFNGCIERIWFGPMHPFDRTCIYMNASRLLLHTYTLLNVHRIIWIVEKRKKKCWIKIAVCIFQPKLSGFIFQPKHILVMGHVIADDSPHFNKTTINLLPRNNVVHIRLCDDLLSFISSSLSDTWVYTKHTHTLTHKKSYWRWQTLRSPRKRSNTQKNEFTSYLFYLSESIQSKHNKIKITQITRFKMSEKRRNSVIIVTEYSVYTIYMCSRSLPRSQPTGFTRNLIISEWWTTNSECTRKMLTEHREDTHRTKVSSVCYFGRERCLSLKLVAIKTYPNNLIHVRERAWTSKNSH